MISVLRPGTIVSVDYADFEGNIQHGLFCVLYDEQIDSSHNFKNNFTAIKITTSFNMITSYCVPVTDGKSDKLFSRPCMALCSKLHTFDKSQVVGEIGRLHPHTLRQIYKCYRRFITELERQIEDYI